MWRWGLLIYRVDIHGAGGTTVVVVMGTLGLVEGLLGTTLVTIGLHTTGDTVTGIGDGFLNLVLGGLGGVRSDLLLGLCTKVGLALFSLVDKSAGSHTIAEILAHRVRHDCRCFKNEFLFEGL